MDVGPVGAGGCGGCGGAAVQAEALEDFLQVRFDRVHRAAENTGDLSIGFSLGNPMQHLRLSLSEIEGLGENANGFKVIGSVSMGGTCHIRP